VILSCTRQEFAAVQKLSAGKGAAEERRWLAHDLDPEGRNEADGLTAAACWSAPTPLDTSFDTNRHKRKDTSTMRGLGL
jgi:hypothetical protein